MKAQRSTWFLVGPGIRKGTKVRGFYMQSPFLEAPRPDFAQIRVETIL